MTSLSWQFRIVFYQDLPVLGLSSSARSHYCLFLSNSAPRFLKAQRCAGTVLHQQSGLLTDIAERWEGPASISHRSDPAYGTVDASKLEEKLKAISLSKFLGYERELSHTGNDRVSEGSTSPGFSINIEN